MVFCMSSNALGLNERSNVQFCKFQTQLLWAISQIRAKEFVFFFFFFFFLSLIDLNILDT